MMTVLGQDPKTGGTLAIRQDCSTSSVPITKTIVHRPTTATKATVTIPAGGAGVHHVCAGISASIATGATAQTPINLDLIDGASGGNAYLWSASAAAPANSAAWWEETGVAIQGTANTQMTLEFSAAGVAASLETVTIHYYDVFESNG